MYILYGLGKWLLQFIELNKLMASPMKCEHMFLDYMCLDKHFLVL